MSGTHGHVGWLRSPRALSFIPHCRPRSRHYLDGFEIGQRRNDMARRLRCAARQKEHLMTRLHLLVGLSVISISALGTTGCIPVTDPNGNSGGGSSYTYCYCDTDCPRGSICDEEYGRWILPVTTTGGPSGTTGGGSGDAGHGYAGGGGKGRSGTGGGGQGDGGGPGARGA